MVRSRQSVDWNIYFDHIKTQCPWSWAAWQQGKIDIVKYKKTQKPLDGYQARIYIVELSRRRLKKLCKKLDQGDSEWLWSEPGYGPWATPVPCLIQQNRAQLTAIRKKLEQNNASEESLHHKE